MMPVSVGIIANPPRRPITRTISRPAPVPTAPAATKVNSNHWAATRSRLRAIAQRARSAPAAAKGTAASRMATVSAMITQVSSTPIAIGVYQRRGARSSTRNTISSGTWVPMWSGCESSSWMPLPSCGASMIPAAISARVQPSQPPVLPLASTPARMTRSV